MVELEKDIKKKIKRYLDSHVCFNFPYNPFMSKAGMPDRIVTILTGYGSSHNLAGYLMVLGLEVKRAGKMATKIQMACHRELEANGWIVGVVRSVQDVKDLLAKYGIKLIKKEKISNEQ